MAKLMETWWSGLTYLFAKEAGPLNGLEGSNPSVSASSEQSERVSETEGFERRSARAKRSPERARDGREAVPRPSETGLARVAGESLRLRKTLYVTNLTKALQLPYASHTQYPHI